MLIELIASFDVFGRKLTAHILFPKVSMKQIRKILVLVLIAIKARMVFGSSIILTDIYGMNEIFLTDGNANDRDPNWSPDEQWVVFASDRNEGDDLYIVSDIGDKLANLTQSPSRY